MKSLSEEVAKLKAQINRNSKNGSKPPSIDQKGNIKTPKKRIERKEEEGFVDESLSHEKNEKA